LLAALLSVAALVACGGSDSNSGSASTEGTETSPRSSDEDTTGENGAKPREKQAGQVSKDEESGSDAEVHIAPLQVSGGGSGQYRVKEGDNSIQDFGEESSEDELEEAATVLHDFYVARVRREWQRACSKLSAIVIDQLKTLASHAKQSGQGCAETLAGLTPSLRTEDERSFLIYRGGEETVYAIIMAEEDGWKVGALAPVPLS
jgi:hypothetical protein